MKFYPDGSIYAGTTVNKIPNGLGTLYCPNEEVYHGRFSNGIIQSGTFIFNGSSMNLSLLDNPKQEPQVRKIIEENDELDVMPRSSSSLQR